MGVVNAAAQLAGNLSAAREEAGALQVALRSVENSPVSPGIGAPGGNNIPLSDAAPIARTGAGLSSKPCPEGIPLVNSNGNITAWFGCGPPTDKTASGGSGNVVSGGGGGRFTTNASSSSGDDVARSVSSLGDSVAQGTMATRQNTQQSANGVNQIVNELRILGDRVVDAIGSNGGPFAGSRQQRRERL